MKSIIGLIKIYILAVLGKKYSMGDTCAVSAGNYGTLWDIHKTAKEKGQPVRFTVAGKGDLDREAVRFVCKFLHYAMARYEKSLPVKIYYYGVIRGLTGKGSYPPCRDGRVYLPAGLIAAYGWEHHVRLILRRLMAPCVRCIAGLMAVFYKPRRLTSPKELYITGWYGTETTGDKAILGGIIREARGICPALTHIHVSSIVPYFTEETMEQLSIGGMRYGVIGRGWRDNGKAIRRSDWAVMGGGPLMELYEVYTVLLTVMRARLRGKRTVIWGCGIGPLHKKGMKRAVRLLLRLSDLVILRDAFSPTVYAGVTTGIEYHPCIDPAVQYLLDVRDEIRPTKKDEDKKTVLFCIRELPLQYCTSKEEHVRIKDQFIQEIGKTVERLLHDARIRIRFFPMNTFVIGQDDREYYEEIKKVLPQSERIEFLRKDFTLHEAIGEFMKVDAAVAMRFHSVVFANTLGVPTLAVDYDMLGGKIRGFMEGISLMDRHVPIAEATAERMLPMIQDLLGKDGQAARIQDGLNEVVDRMSGVIKNAMDGTGGGGS